MRTRDSNERRLCVLLALLRRESITCNAAGDCLRLAGLLDTTGRASNDCLPGGAVLRALERAGLARGHTDRDARHRYTLTERGRDLAAQADLAGRATR